MYSNMIVSTAICVLTSLSAATAAKIGYHGPTTATPSPVPSSTYVPPIPLNSLAPLYSSSSVRPVVVDIVAIKEKLSLYPLAIDGKNYAALDHVFAPNVIANLSQGGLIYGLPALEKALEASFPTLNTHHSLGTTEIDVQKGGFSADSVTYFTATLFGTGKNAGKYAQALGQYQDKWVKIPTGEWLIINRNLLFIGNFLGDPSIVQG